MAPSSGIPCRASPLVSAALARQHANADAGMAHSTLGTPPGGRLYVTAMSDTQIIDLDEPEPVTARAPWRPGSLAIVVTPLVVAALVVSLAVPRLADGLAAQLAPLSTPEPTPGGGWLTFPTPNVTTPIVTPLGASRETGNAEVLETQHW